MNKNSNKWTNTSSVTIIDDSNNLGKNKKRAPVKKGVNFKTVKKFVIKHQVIFLLLIPILLSIFFRAYPYYLPITDGLAKENVYENIYSDISNNVYQNNPDLINKELYIEKEFQRILKEQKNEINQEIKATSEYFKSRMRDENGQTYLFYLDPYLWYGHARNYVNNGHFGDAMFEGESVYTLRNGRHNFSVPQEIFLSYSEAQLYKIVKIFNPNVSLISICFVMPLLFITLSIVPAFFIGRRLAGNLGGLIAGIIVATNAYLLGRTTAGFSDTDPFMVFFPLLITWIFIEAFEAKNKNKKFMLAGLSGLTVGIFSFAWTGWWYIFDFILAGLVVYLAYQLIIHRKQIKEGVLKIINNPDIKNIWQTGGIFAVVSILFVSLFFGFTKTILRTMSPFGFIEIKTLATKENIWPNVMLTVQEFEEVPLKEIMSAMGGTFLFSISLIGIAIMIFLPIINEIKEKKERNKKEYLFYGLLLAIWFVGSAYAFTKGIRFSILMVPAFAIALGMAINTLYKYLPKQINKLMNINVKISKIIIIVILCLISISLANAAHERAKNDVPLINDAWYETLTEIKEDSDDAIITSWWDHGYWFSAIAERRATFDGGDQGTKIYWIGRTLLTDNEQEALGILRMLNCDQNNAYEKLEKYGRDNLTSVLTLGEVVKTKSREEAKVILKNSELELTNEQIENILDSTHCDNLIDQYFIVSEDLIGKTKAWGHFGLWDSERAKIYLNVEKKGQEEGIEILKTQFDKTENEAFKMYHEIQNQHADSWISGQLKYDNLGLTNCLETNESIMCDNGLQFNKTTNDAFILTTEGIRYLNSIVYVEKNKDGKEEVIEKKYSENTISLSAALVPIENGTKSIFMDPELASSMFTRMFFYEGRGLQNFELFSHKTQVNFKDIYVYKVKFD